LVLFGAYYAIFIFFIFTDLPQNRMPSINQGPCAYCGRVVWSQKPSAPYAALTPNKADLLIAFYHLGFASATKPTEESMAAALEARALIHNACVIQTNQVAGNPPLLAKYNRLRAKRDAELPAAAAFHNPDRSNAALEAQFAAAATHQHRTPSVRACNTSATPAAPATQYSRTPTTATAAAATPHVKKRVQDARTRIHSQALTPCVPAREWPLLDAYLRDRPVLQPDVVVAFAGRLVLALPHVALTPESVFAFVQQAVPRLLVDSGAPGGVVPFAGGAGAAPLLVPLGVNSVLHSQRPLLNRAAGTVPPPPPPAGASSDDAQERRRIPRTRQYARATRRAAARWCCVDEMMMIMMTCWHARAHSSAG